MSRKKYRKHSAVDRPPTANQSRASTKRRKRSLLAESMARALLSRMGFDFDKSRPVDPNEHTIHRVVISGKRVSATSILTNGLSIWLRHESPDADCPFVSVRENSEPILDQGEDVDVHAMLVITAVTKSVPHSLDPAADASASLNNAEHDAWSAKWPETPAEWDETDVSAPGWEEFELPAYLIPDVAFQTPYDWNKPLEYALASMPEHSVILPMDDSGNDFGHGERHIHCWAYPTPLSDKFSKDEDEARKITVRFRYRIVGWTKGWRDDHKKKFEVDGSA